jgi:hypothetical protein
MGAGASTHSGDFNAVTEADLGSLKYSNIELDSWPGKLHSQTGLPPTFQLLLGHESLDFIDNQNKPLVQFPYQVIISWGYSATTFRFSIPAKAADENTTLPAHESVSVCIRTPVGVSQVIDRNIMKTVLKLMDDMKKRSTVTTNEFHILKKSLFIQPSKDGNAAHAEGLPISTAIPAESNEATPDNTIPTKTPQELKEDVLVMEELHDDWMQTITQFSASRAFLAKQAMELVQYIGPLAPFERMDLAEMLYDCILNKESFQLVINAIEDQHERDNLAHRLKLKGYTTNTTLIC